MEGQSSALHFDQRSMRLRRWVFEASLGSQVQTWITELLDNIFALMVGMFITFTIDNTPLLLPARTSGSRRSVCRQLPISRMPVGGFSLHSVREEM